MNELTPEEVANGKHAAWRSMGRVAVRYLDHNFTPFVANGAHARGETNFADTSDVDDLAKTRELSTPDYFGRTLKKIQMKTLWGKPSQGGRYLYDLNRLLEDVRNKRFDVERWRNHVRSAYGGFLAHVSGVETDESARQKMRKLADGPKPNWLKDKPQVMQERLAAVVAFCAPHHARILKRFIEDPTFPHNKTDRDKLIRSLAFYDLNATLPESREQPSYRPNWNYKGLADPTFTPDISNEELKELLEKGTLKIAGDDFTPRSYNAAAIIPASFVTPNKPGRSFSYRVARTPNNPIYGLQILEPSVQAAREAAKRYHDTHWKEHPEDAFPVYDYRGRKVWPC